MVKTVDIGQPYGALPVRMTVKGLSDASKKIGRTTLEVMSLLSSGEMHESDLVTLLWEAVNHGQHLSRNVVFKSEEDFFEWAMEAMLDAAIQIGYVEDEEELKTIDSPVARITESVAEDLRPFLERISKRAQQEEKKRNPLPPSAIPEDHD